jgi:GDP-L-fucose synthase
MPTNLYGPNDNYDLKNSHVLPALLRKMMTAKAEGHPSVSIWGTGTPRREFLHVDDMADACLFLMEQYEEPGHVNIGCGDDISILELAQLIAQVIGYAGEIIPDTGKPDGTPRKLMDVTRINRLGWKYRIGLEEGIRRTWQELQDSPRW